MGNSSDDQPVLAEHRSVEPEPRSREPGHAAARLVVLSGPSGVGKGSVVTEIRQSYSDVGMWLSISVTTRPPRPEEIDGRNYWFVSDMTFTEMVDAGAFLEHARYAGYRYGTPRKPVEEHLREGQPVLLEIDIQGARQVREAMPEALLVFLVPPSTEELEERLRGRGTEDEAVVQQRLELARSELAAAEEFDVIVINDRVKTSAQKLLPYLSSLASMPKQKTEDDSVRNRGCP